MAKETASNIIKTIVIIVAMVATMATTIVSTSYMNGKTAGKVEEKFANYDKVSKIVEQHDKRINDMEIKDARFEGIMSERTETMQDDLQDIKSKIQKLLENLQLVE